MFSRRDLITGACLALSGTVRAADNTARQVEDLERRARGRLGVAALDTHSQQRFTWRAAEHFPMCSTFKLLAVGAVLRRVDEGREQLERRLPYGKAELLDYAPVTRAHLKEGGMTLRALCAAAIEVSDNTAANLLLSTLGGPDAVTQYARTLGDYITRLDRTEPTLNSAVPGDARDTTSPGAMLEDARWLLLGEALSSASRQALTGWLMASQTGTQLIRAGLPKGWVVGDKTGSGGHGTTNDVAIVWPAERKPVLLSIYFTGSSAGAAARDAVIAQAARIVTATLL